MESLLGLLEMELNGVREFRDVTFDQISEVMMSLGDWKRSVEKSETMKTNFLEQARKLALQEKKLVGYSDLLRQREKEVEVKIKRFEECCVEFERKEKELELIKIRIQDSSAEFNLKEEQLNECNKELSSKKQELHECDKELSLKIQELGSVNMELEELNNKVLLKKKDLSEVQKSLEKRSAELETVGRSLGFVRKKFRKCSKKLGIRQKKLELVKKSLWEHSKKLEHKEKELQEVENLININQNELEDKEKQHDIITNSVHQCCMKLKLKEKELELTEESLKQNLEKLHAEDERLGSIGKKLGSLKESIKHCEDLKGLELDAIQKSILERQKELELEEELLKSVKSSIVETAAELILMSEQRMSIQKSITECTKELETKQSSLDSMRKCLEECCSEISIKEVQQSVIQIVFCEYLRELQEENTYFNSLNRTMEERVRELRKEETRLEGNVVKLNSMKQKFYFSQKSLEGRRREAHREGRQTSTILPSSQKIRQCNSSRISLSPVLQCCIIGSGSKLQMLLNEQVRKNELFHFQIFELLQISPDPAKLVLDAMQGFYPSGLNNEHMGFDLNVIRKGCVTLLEQVVKITPQIKPHVRDEALKLAMEWKEKMNPRHEDSLETLTFLKLVAVYKLNSAFSVDELRNLLEVVECKQKHDLHEALGKGIRRGDIEQAKYSDGKPCSLFVNFRSNLTTSVRSPELLFNDLAVDQDLSIGEVRDGIQFSPDPAKLVLDVLHGSFFQFWNKGSSGLSAHLMRNVVVLLEQLMNSSPKVSPQVKETALQQVLLWKDNISTETQNSYEVLAFLMFLAVYDLVSFFERDEILVLVETVIHHRQAPEICRTLGFTSEIAGLTMNLIQREQFLEAARFSCAFELSVKFLPETILTSYLRNTMNDAGLSSTGNNSFEDQCNIIDKKIKAFREFVECVADCKLERIFPRETYMRYIAELEGTKTRLAQTYPYKAQQSLQSNMAQQSPQLSSSDYYYQLLFGPRKRSRVDTTYN